MRQLIPENILWIHKGNIVKGGKVQKFIELKHFYIAFSLQQWPL